MAIGDALQGRIRGMREAKAAFQAMPEAFRDAMADATFVTVSEIARIAKARVQASPSIRTRALYDSIGYVMNYRNGRGKAGIQNVTSSFTSAGTRVRVKGAVVSSGGRVVRMVPRRYAHLVEFGTRHSPAEPFMLPAAADQKAPYLDRCRRAGVVAERTIAAIGGRTV